MHVDVHQNSVFNSNFHAVWRGREIEGNRKDPLRLSYSIPNIPKARPQHIHNLIPLYGLSQDQNKLT